MLLVKTNVQPSPIHGLGLFADEFIPKSTVIWKFTPGFDQKFTRKQILSFPEDLQVYLYRYAWKSEKSKLYCFASDNGKYFNYSENPNAHSKYQEGEEEVVTTAVRDIQKGEEITDDYASFESGSDADNILYAIAEKHHLVDEFDPRKKH